MSPLKGGTVPCFGQKVQSIDRGSVGKARLVESPLHTTPSLPCWAEMRLSPRQQVPCCSWLWGTWQEVADRGLGKVGLMCAVSGAVKSLITDYCSSGKHCKGQGKAWLTCAKPQPQASMWVMHDIITKREIWQARGRFSPHSQAPVGRYRAISSSNVISSSNNMCLRSFGQALPQASW